MTVDAISLSPSLSMEKAQWHSPKSSSLAKLCRKLSPIKADKRTLSSPVSSNCSSELERVFDYFDENGDGKISPAKLQTCVRTVGGELSAEEAQAAVEASDLDGDGLLGFEEFHKLMDDTNEDEENKKELRDAFGMYEMEGSGCITPTSLRRMLARLGESRSIEDCKTMIRMFDLNGDGVLNFDEFQIMMKSTRMTHWFCVHSYCFH